MSKARRNSTYNSVSVTFELIYIAINIAQFLERVEITNRIISIVMIQQSGIKAGFHWRLRRSRKSPSDLVKIENQSRNKAERNRSRKTWRN